MSEVKLLQGDCIEQIISWFENRAKCDMDNEEFQNMIRKYFQN